MAKNQHPELTRTIETTPKGGTRGEDTVQTELTIVFDEGEEMLLEYAHKTGAIKWQGRVRTDDTIPAKAVVKVSELETRAPRTPADPKDRIKKDAKELKKSGMSIEEIVELLKDAE